MTNLMTTMALGGLWHGAAWTFVVWGILHGFLLAAESVVRRHVQLPANDLTVFLVRVLTFTTVTCGWVVFRSTSLDQAGTILGGIIEARARGSLLPGLSVLLLTLAFGAHLLSAQLGHLRAWYVDRCSFSPVAEGLVIGLVVFFLLMATPFDQQQFIYFQF